MLPDFNVKFDDQVRFVDRFIFPVVLLPMVSRLAVMLPSSVCVRPKLPVDFVPRSTTVSDVGINRTEPEVVALTVLVIVKFWAVT